MDLRRFLLSHNTHPAAFGADTIFGRRKDSFPNQNLYHCIKNRHMSKIIRQPPFIKQIVRDNFANQRCYLFGYDLCFFLKESL